LIKTVKNPGNGRLNDLNDPVLNVLKYTLMVTGSCRYIQQYSVLLNLSAWCLL